MVVSYGDLASEAGGWERAQSRRRALGGQEQPARHVRDSHLQYDFGGILGGRAEDRKVSVPADSGAAAPPAVGDPTDPLSPHPSAGWTRWEMPWRKCSARRGVSAPSPSACTRPPSCSMCK